MPSIRKDKEIRSRVSKASISPEREAVMYAPVLVTHSGTLQIVFTRLLLFTCSLLNTKRWLSNTPCKHLEPSGNIYFYYTYKVTLHSCNVNPYQMLVLYCSYCTGNGRSEEQEPCYHRLRLGFPPLTMANDLGWEAAWRLQNKCNYTINIQLRCGLSHFLLKLVKPTTELQ